jgi:hypothetical protein
MTVRASAPSLAWPPAGRVARPVAGWWRWAALPLGVLYLVLLATRFRDVVATANLDADTVSAPVIGQLFASAPAHAGVVLGEFGWYASLLFELATKWLPSHRQIWEAAPYAMSLAGFALTAWAVWRVAGRWAASLAAVLLVCAAPQTLHLMLSMTQHAPDWFCLSLLGAVLVLLERRAAALRWTAIVPLCLVTGTIVGANAASDPLVVIAAIVPFALALIAGAVRAEGPDGARALRIGLGCVAVTGIAWAATAVVMAALDVGPERGVHTTMLATGEKILVNLRLWSESIAVLGNGDFFGARLSFSSGLAIACAALSAIAVVVLMRAGWRVARAVVGSATTPVTPARLTFLVFWCTSAAALSVAFVLSAAPVDVHADRYLVGLIYAVAAVIPVTAAGRTVTETAALAGTCVVALGGVVAMAQGASTRDTEGFPSTAVAHRIGQLAARDHLRVGYAGYWDAAPITWATHLSVQVFPVSVCDQGAHLCRFDLHYITSWYAPRAGIGSFLLTDRALSGVSHPTADLGHFTAEYHIGSIVMYVYPYDLATRIVQ